MIGGVLTRSKDNNTANNVTNESYLSTYIDFIGKIHEIWPKANVVICSLWNGFTQVGDSWVQGGAFIDEIKQVAEHYKADGFVHYFDTTGILQHNDIVSISLCCVSVISADR